jgi:UDP-glucuronate 4-epimerase
MHYIEVLEAKLGVKAKLNLLPMQPGDVTRTEADTATTRAILDYSPSTTVEVGIGHFVDWYREYFQV